MTELDTELEVADKELKKSAEEKKQLEADCNEVMGLSSIFYESAV